MTGRNSMRCALESRFLAQSSCCVIRISHAHAATVKGVGKTLYHAARGMLPAWWPRPPDQAFGLTESGNTSASVPFWSHNKGVVGANGGGKMLGLSLSLP